MYNLCVRVTNRQMCLFIIYNLYKEINELTIFRTFSIIM